MRLSHTHTHTRSVGLTSSGQDGDTESGVGRSQPRQLNAGTDELRQREATKRCNQAAKLSARLRTRDASTSTRPSGTSWCQRVFGECASPQALQPTQRRLKKTLKIQPKCHVVIATDMRRNSEYRPMQEGSRDAVLNNFRSAD